MTAQANPRLCRFIRGGRAGKHNIRLGARSPFGDAALVIDTFAMADRATFGAEPGLGIGADTMGCVQNIRRRRIFMTAQAGFNANFGRIRRARGRAVGQGSGKACRRDQA